MAQQNQSQRLALCLWIALITMLAGFLRMQAVLKLPVDFDELVYLPVAFRYEELMAAGKWKDITAFAENMEHPPLNKLLFAADLSARRPREPDWNVLHVGKPIPPEAESAFRGPRIISAVGGTLQVLIAAIVHPLGGLVLALDTYHVKYSAQVYLEGVPGLMAVLAVFLGELALRKQKPPTDEPVPLRWPALLLSAAALGLSAAGKYLYGAVGFVIVAFLILRTRSAKGVLVYCLAALFVFFLADPFLWQNPAARLWASLTYHWHYAHSEHVVSSGMPWYSPFKFLVQSAPTEWHPGVFYTGVADLLLIPLSLIGLRRAMRERPIWVAWAGFGIVVLLLWPTKWPQYTLLVRPPLAVCAGIGIAQFAAAVSRKVRRPSV